MNDQIYEACKKGDLATLKELVQQTSQMVNKQHPTERKYPFTIAALNNHLEIVKYLLSKHVEDPHGFPLSIGEVLWEHHYDDDDDYSSQYTRKDILNCIYEKFDQCQFNDGTIKTHVAAVVDDKDFCKKNIDTIFTPDKHGITPCYYILSSSSKTIANLVSFEKILSHEVIVLSALEQQGGNYNKMLAACTQLNDMLSSIDKTGRYRMATMQAAIECVIKKKSFIDPQGDDYNMVRRYLTNNAMIYVEYLLEDKRDYENAVITLKETIKTLKKDISKFDVDDISQMYVAIAKIYSRAILLSDKADPSHYYYLALDMMSNSTRINVTLMLDLFYNWQKIFFVHSPEWNFLGLGLAALRSYQPNNNFANLLQQTLHALDFSSISHEQKNTWRQMVVKLIESLFIIEETDSTLKISGTGFISDKENRAFILGKLAELKESLISPLAKIVENHPATTSALVRTVAHLRQSCEKNEGELVELRKENQLLKDKLSELNSQLSTVTTNSKPLPATTSVDTLKMTRKRNVSSVPKDSPILSNPQMPNTLLETSSEMQPNEAKHVKRNNSMPH